MDLGDIITYDPTTGLFKWIDIEGSHNCRKMRGWFDPNQNGGGYRRIMVNGKKYYAHRLAVRLMTGSFPEKEVDHIDRNPSNNKWCNLRCCDRTVNNLNTRGKGVSKVGSKYRAYVTYNNKKHHLGYFNDKEEALQVVKKTREKFIIQHEGKAA